MANTVTLSTNFNVAPYWDDFDEIKNFHRILYRPGAAVQARELTQMQTILQNQIDRFAEHIFREGSAVRGCEVSALNTRYDYVKLQDNDDVGASVNVFSFLNKTIKGSTTGVLAVVSNVADGSQANTPDFKTFFVNYISANTQTQARTFANDEILVMTANSDIRARAITSEQGGATGFGSAISINEGVIFAKDHFIRVDPQTIVLDKYASTPTYRVGFIVEENIITSADDTTLLDPASGSYNYAAPGANRLKLTARLTKTTDATLTSNSFVEFVNVKEGVIQTLSDKPQYSAIRDELAKRTREESGDYIVRGLFTKVREHFNNGTNQGLTPQGSPLFLSVDVSPGKAYIQGYDNELLVTSHVQLPKGTDFITSEGVSLYADYQNYILVNDLVGSWDFNGQDRVSLRAGGQANAISTATFSRAAPGVEIGTARVRDIEHVSGTPGLPSAQYKLFLTDVQINSGQSFTATESIVATNAAFANGVADVVAAVNTANTSEPFYNMAVFPLPAKAIRRLRTAAGAVNAEFGFRRNFSSVSFSAGGSVSIARADEGGEATEKFDGNGVLSDSLARRNYYVIARASANTTNLTGTITVTNGSNTVTGSGTSFTTQVNPGDVIACSPDDKFVVSEVVDNTNLNLVSLAPSSRSGSFHKRFLPGQVIDMGGTGGTGVQRTITVTGGGTNVVLDVKETFNVNLVTSVSARMSKSTAEQANKIARRNSLVQIVIGSGGVGGYTASTSGPWNLGISDAFRLVEVRKKTGAFSSTTEGTDVTSHFTLDTGQRDSHYDHAKLVKKPSSTLSIGGSDRLLVKVDSFGHDERKRGYFSVDSYPVDDTLAATDTTKIYTYEIPIFTSQTTGLAFDLRDCVDFRPRLTDTANNVTTLTNISTNPLGVGTPGTALTNPQFDEPTGGIRFPFSGSQFETDLSYYLPRKDLIVMTKEGKCEAILGVSSLDPKLPPSDPEKMTLAILDIAPYPSLPDNIARDVGRTDLANSMKLVKNDRFTMRDIGAIRDRVEKLEYYTTLSLLERETKDLTIRDASGNDRFKNGFLVDSFIGHAVGNVYDPDYKIAIDPARREARPPCKIDNIELQLDEERSINVVRSNVFSSGVSRDVRVTINTTKDSFTAGSTVISGSATAVVRSQVKDRLYLEQATGLFVVGASITQSGSSTTAVITAVKNKNAGRLITLPYTHEPAIRQPYASTTRNPAGLSYNWQGTVILEPNSDYWVDTVNKPDVQINVDNNADNWEVLADAFGTQWGSWETVATGVPILASVDTSSTRSSVSSSVQSTDISSTRSSTITTETTTTNQETYTQDISQNRTGTQLGVSRSVQIQELGSYVRDVNIQPHMRPKLIKIQALGFKPSSILYSFFDGINVSEYVTPTDEKFTKLPGTKRGSLLITDKNGNAYGTFELPNSSRVSFRIGEKIFRLTDSPKNSSLPGLVTTAGQAVYAAQGLTAGSSDLTVSTTVADIAVNTITASQTISQISTVVRQDTSITTETITDNPVTTTPVVINETIRTDTSETDVVLEPEFPGPCVDEIVIYIPPVTLNSGVWPGIETVQVGTFTDSVTGSVYIDQRTGGIGRTIVVRNGVGEAQLPSGSSGTSLSHRQLIAEENLDNLSLSSDV